MVDLDPGQRDHELAKALVTLLIAVSRYGTNDKHARPTVERLAVITEIATLLADGVAERISAISGEQAAADFRKTPRRRRP